MSWFSFEICRILICEICNDIDLGSVKTPGLSKKDKCPCQTSDTSSWKPKFSKCNQTWHTACCNLKGIVSITELENWECPWCHIPKFNDPSKPKQVSSVLKDMQRDVNTIQTCFSSFNAAELRNEISEFQKSIDEVKETSAASNENNSVKMCDEIVKSINFELQKAITDQQSSFAQEISELKKSLCSRIPEVPSSKKTSNSSIQGHNVSVFNGKPFDHHIRNFLSEEARDGLESFVNQNTANFTNINNREVIYFGEFSYKYGKTEHKPAPMPDVIQEVIDIIHDKFPSNSKLNSCLVTKYENGSCTCPPHGDNEPFISPGSDIFTFSIGASRTMKFESCSDHANQINESVKLETNDLISFSRNSQDFYHHSIIPDETVNQPRFSLTFRSLAPYNLNYLAIIGDSNTQDLVFGEGMGKLGRWMPGSKFKASRIKNIPDPHTIGPCRNMLINVGVNDIQGDNPKSADFLSTLYETKVKSLLAVYPKARIFISLLLPTKDAGLNFRINELNKHLRNIAANIGNVQIIEHYNLVNENGFLNQMITFILELVG